MKKLISIMLVCVLCLTAFVTVFTASADGSATATKTVYLSDNGDDAKDGLTSANAVKTYAKAQEILGAAGGIIMIPDIYTYAGSFTYTMPYVQGASYIIRGEKADGSSQFVHNRKNIAMSNPITFDNLTYKITANTWSSLIANFNALEITESVTIVPYNNVNERNNYLFVYGGAYNGSGAAGQNTNVTLNGGTYGYVVGGCKAGEMQGSVTINIGGKAEIINRLYCGGEGTPNDVYGGLYVNISGGKIGENIFLGASGDATFVTCDTKLTVTGGEFAAIYCRGTSGGVNNGNITIDVTGYAPAQAEGWADTYIKDRTAKTTIVGLPEAETTTPEETTTEEVTTEAATTEATTTEATTTEAATTDAATTAPDATETTGKTDDKKSGCGSVVSVSCVGAIILIGLGAGMLRRKEQ